MTPYELSIAVKVHNQKMKEKQEELKLETELAFTQAFYTAYWQRLERLSKKDLNKVLDRLGKGEIQPQPKEMSDEEMLKQIMALNAQFGGTVINEKGGN